MGSAVAHSHAEVRFVGKEVGPVVTEGGALLLGVTHEIADTTAPDLVVVPGGSTTPGQMVDDDVLDWLRRVAAASCNTEIAQRKVRIAGRLSLNISIVDSPSGGQGFRNRVPALVHLSLATISKSRQRRTCVVERLPPVVGRAVTPR